MRGISLVVVASIMGCGFDGPGVAGGADPDEIELVLDGIDELAGSPPAATLERLRVYPFPGGDRPGTVEPGLYAIGSLRAEGQAARVFPDVRQNADFEARYDAANIVGRNLITARPFSAPPAGLRIPNNDFTVWMRGEIFLEAGSHQLELQVDHDGFLDLFGPFAPAGFLKLKGRYAENLGQLAVDVAATGWYPFRAAWTNDNGLAGWTLLHGIAGGSKRPIEEWRIRSYVGDLQGALVSGFEGLELTGEGARARAIDPTPFVDSWSPEAPSQTGLTGPDRSFRHAAQVRVDGGLHTFQVTTDGTYRLWIDGVRVDGAGAAGFSSPPATFQVELEPGWHDVALDVSRNGDRGQVSLEMAPPGGAPAPIDPARTRPSIGATSRLRSVADSTTRVSTSGQTIALAIDAPAQPALPHAVTQVDVGIAMSTGNWPGMRIELEAGGATIPIFAEPASTRTGAQVLRLHVPGDQLPASLPPGGTWRVRTNQGATITYVSLVIHHRGGGEAIPLTGIYESPLLDLGAPRSLSRVEVEAATSPASPIAVLARTCRAPGDCGDYRPASELPEAPGPFAQVRLELASDGARGAIVDAIRVRAKPAE